MEFITLKNKNEVNLIDGVILHPLKINQDESGGILVETLRKDWKEIYGPGREFSMQYYSVTPPGVARDENVWHLHPGYQEDRFLMASGKVVTAIADPRENSKSKGVLNLFLMDALTDPYILLVPKGTLHGFLVVSHEPAILLNYPTGIYNPEEELRVPYKKANIRTANGEMFSWDKVKKELGFPSSDE